MVDPVAALAAFLRADPDVAVLVGARVFGAELPRNETDSMPRKAIVVRPAGGLQVIGSGYQDYGDLRLDIFCYGETPREAGRAWQAAHTALKQLRRTVQSGALVHWCRPAGGPIALRDPDADWPYTVSTWQVLISESQVA